METKHIELLAEVKSADGDEGTFTALASVFNNVDLVGDRVRPGAFKRTIEDWTASGRKIPVIFNHNWEDIHSHIGYANPEDVKETDEGLQFKAYLDTAENETARAVHRNLKRGTLTGMSFGYTVKSEKVAKDGVNDLLDLDLIEFGPTLKGANPEAQLQAVKSAVETTTSEGTEDGDGEEAETPKPSPQDPLRAELDRARLDAALGR